VVAQLFGHTAFNAALPVVGAPALALAILLEVPGATAVAWVWLGQTPPPGAVPGLLTILAGLALASW
jgi:drug/metabolite transporter (DMT)-like permease